MKTILAILAIAVLAAFPAAATADHCHVGNFGVGVSSVYSNGYVAGYHKAAVAPLAVQVYPYLVPSVATVYSPAYPELRESSARAAVLRAEARALEAQANAVDSLAAKAASTPLATSHAYAQVQTFAPAVLYPAAAKINVNAVGHYGVSNVNGVRVNVNQNRRNGHANGVNVNAFNHGRGADVQVNVNADNGRGGSTTVRTLTRPSLLGRGNITRTFTRTN